MTILDYTSYDEVRAVLGVSSTELPDLAISQPMYGSLLLLALEDVDLSLPTLFSTLSAIPADTITISQARLVTLVRLYAPHSVADKLLTSLPMFGIQSLTDGRAGFARQNDVSIYADVKVAVKLVLEEIRARLALAYLKLVNPAATSLAMPVLVFAAATGILKDPVTNI